MRAAISKEKGKSDNLNVNVREDSRARWKETSDGFGDELWVENVRIPQNFVHMIENPTGLKSKRDAKLTLKSIRMKQKLVMAQQKKTASFKDEDSYSKRQSVISRAVMDAASVYFNEGDYNSVFDEHMFSRKNEYIVPLFRKAGMKIDEVVVSKDIKHCKLFWKCKYQFKDKVKEEVESPRFIKRFRKHMTSEIPTKYALFYKFEMREEKEEEDKQLKELYGQAMDWTMQNKEMFNEEEMKKFVRFMRVQKEENDGTLNIDPTPLEGEDDEEEFYDDDDEYDDDDFDYDDEDQLPHMYYEEEKFPKEDEYIDVYADDFREVPLDPDFDDQHFDKNYFNKTN